MKAVDNARESGLATTRQVCNCIHLQRDAYYKCRERDLQRRSVDCKVTSLVKAERNIQARVGTRKLHKELRDTFLK